MTLRGIFDTIETVKKVVEKREGIPVHSQRLFFKEQELENSETLSKYVFDSIELWLQTSTDLKVLDVVKPKTQKIGTGNLLYWNVNPGLNYGGKCCNEKCKANGQKVMFHRGFGIIAPTDDEHIEEIIRCPGCKEKFEITGFFFYRCKVEVIYKKENDKETTRMPPKIVSGDDYWELDEESEEKANYVVLKFTVKELED